MRELRGQRIMVACLLLGVHLVLGGVVHAGIIRGKLEDNLSILNKFESKPEGIVQLYEAIYRTFAAKPDATYADVASNTEIQDLCAKESRLHLGGPMLGAVSPDGVKVWLRTVRPAKVEVRVLVSNEEKIFGPIESTAATDLTAVVPVTGLAPGGRYRYRVLVDGKPIPIPEHATIPTPVAENDPQKVRIAFGADSHRWGLGNPKLWTAIRGREPAAMLLYGDIAVQDRGGHGGLHRADYQMRDFQSAWQDFASAVPVYATWDDHDYFGNDSGGLQRHSEADRSRVRETFRRAWNNPACGFETQQQGIFFRTRIGPCDIIMLDTRYFRGGKRQDKAFLGEAQMRWLEAQLSDCRGPFIILSSGTMWSDYISNGKDSWGTNDPEGRERLFSFIEKNRIGGVLLISGDRHGARGCRIPRPSGFNFYEFEMGTLGGSAIADAPPEDVRTFLPSRNGSYAFGEFSIDATMPDPLVTFRLITDDGRVAQEMKLTRSQLTPQEKQNPGSSPMPQGAAGPPETGPHSE